MSTPYDDAALDAVFHDELGLEEISLVPRGANQHANVLTFKADEADDVKASPLARMRALAHRTLDRLTSLVEKYDLPADEAAPLLAGLESAVILGAVAKDDAPAVPASPEALPAPALPAAAPLSTPPEGEGMSATATVQPTPAAATDATAEAVAKMDAMLKDAVAKQEAAEKANALLIARVEKMENERREAALSAEVEKLFEGVPGDRAALTALVAKLDDADKAALAQVTTFAREVAKEAQTFGSRGTVAKSASSTSGSAFDQKVEHIRSTERLSLAEATVKAAELYPELANAVLAEHRAAVASTR